MEIHKISFLCCFLLYNVVTGLSYRPNPYRNSYRQKASINVRIPRFPYWYFQNQPEYRSQTRKYPFHPEIGQEWRVYPHAVTDFYEESDFKSTDGTQINSRHNLRKVSSPSNLGNEFVETGNKTSAEIQSAGKEQPSTLLSQENEKLLVPAEIPKSSGLYTQNASIELLLPELENDQDTEASNNSEILTISNLDKQATENTSESVDSNGQDIKKNESRKIGYSKVNIPASVTPSRAGKSEDSRTELSDSLKIEELSKESTTSDTKSSIRSTEQSIQASVNSSESLKEETHEGVSVSEISSNVSFSVLPIQDIALSNNSSDLQTRNAASRVNLSEPSIQIFPSSDETIKAEMPSSESTVETSSANTDEQIKVVLYISQSVKSTGEWSSIKPTDGKSSTVKYSVTENRVKPSPSLKVKLIQDKHSLDEENLFPFGGSLKESNVNIADDDKGEVSKIQIKIPAAHRTENLLLGIFLITGCVLVLASAMYLIIMKKRTVQYDELRLLP